MTLADPVGDRTTEPRADPVPGLLAVVDGRDDRAGVGGLLPFC